MWDLTMRMSWEVTRACRLHIPLEQVFEPVSAAPTPRNLAEDQGSPRSPRSPKKKLSKDSSPINIGGKGESSAPKESPIDIALKCCEEWKTCYKEV